MKLRHYSADHRKLSIEEAVVEETECRGHNPTVQAALAAVMLGRLIQNLHGRGLMSDADVLAVIEGNGWERIT